MPCYDYKAAAHDSNTLTFLFTPLLICPHLYEKPQMRLGVGQEYAVDSQGERKFCNDAALKYLCLVLLWHP